MKNASAFEKRNLVRTEKRRLARAAKAKSKVKNGKRGTDLLPTPQWRHDHRLDSDPGIIRRSKFKRPGVPRGGV